MQTGMAAVLRCPSTSHLSSPVIPWPPPSNLSPPQQRHFKHLGSCDAKYRRRPWESPNAEGTQNPKFSFDSRFDEEDPVRSSRRRRRRPRRRGRWWSDGDDFSSAPEEEWMLILGQAVDSIWILKVLKSYGWTLLVIIPSWTLVTGPKALLFTLAMFTGISLIPKMWEWLQGSPRIRPGDGSNLSSEEEEDTWTVRNQMKYHPPWIAGKNEDASDKRSTPSFGGWDEPVRETTEVGKRRGPTPVQSIDKMEELLKKGGMNMNRRVKGRDLPLLLRMLVAIFPFLSSWI